MTLIDDLQDAGRSSGGNTCKICDFLNVLPADEADAVDALIRSKANGRNRISNDKVASILRAHGLDTGATTVRRHRVNCAPRTDTEA